MHALQCSTQTQEGLVFTSIIALSFATPADAAPARTFSCEQITIVDPAMELHLDLGFDLGSDVPVAARLTQVLGGRVLLETKPSYRPNYDGGYWFTNYGLDAYALGTVDQWTTYALLVPSGVIGSVFEPQVHLWFDRGAAGWWPNEYSCVELP
jgi:hypothetical protein